MNLNLTTTTKTKTKGNYDVSFLAILLLNGNLQFFLFTNRLENK